MTLRAEVLSDRRVLDKSGNVIGAEISVENKHTVEKPAEKT